MNSKAPPPWVNYAEGKLKQELKKYITGNLGDGYHLNVNSSNDFWGENRSTVFIVSKDRQPLGAVTFDSDQINTSLDPSLSNLEAALKQDYSSQKCQEKIKGYKKTYDEINTKMSELRSRQPKVTEIQELSDYLTGFMENKALPAGHIHSMLPTYFSEFGLSSWEEGETVKGILEKYIQPEYFELQKKLKI